MQPLTVYKASAGSGKTFTLAVEYVKLLVLYAGEKEFTHILAVTFTNKATTEMKDRIIAHLYGVGGTDHVLPSSRSFFSKLRQELGREPGFSASDEEIRRVYREKAKKYHPDALRAQGLPEEMISRAAEQMKKVNAAWSAIRSARGM